MSNLNVILLDLLYRVIDANIAVKVDHTTSIALMMSLLRRTHTKTSAIKNMERRFGIPICVVLDFFYGLIIEEQFGAVLNT